MNLFRSLSGKVILLIFTIFVVSFIPKMSDIASGEDKCLCAYDGYGYYMYLPHFFTEGDLNIKQEWAQRLQNEYCDGIYAYQIVRIEEGRELNVYHLGQAFVELPGYVIGEVSARLLGFKTDGFSKPYYIAFILNVLLFVFLGLLYLRKLLLLYFDEKVTSITILAVYFASNIYITFYLQNDLQHLYLFALNAIFLYHTLLFIRTKSNKHLVYSAIVLGLTVAIRPTQVILGLFPLILLLNTFGIRWAFFKRIWIYPAFGILWNAPQIAYWWIIGGEPFIPNLHTENIILADPNLGDFLFSYKKGWLLYSPVFLIGLHGFILLYRKNKALFWSFALFIVSYVWVMSSWECWWYAQSFGSRVMVDVYPIIAVLIAFSISSWRSRIVIIFGSVFIIGCSLLSMLQTHQGLKGYLSFENMTKQHYWYIFGKIDIPNFTFEHLELDRTNIDPSWIERSKNLPKSDYTYTKTQIFEMNEPIHVENIVHILSDFIVLDNLPTDEGMLEFVITSKTSDSTKRIVLMSETLSKYEWNYYNWSPVEISLGQAQNEFVTRSYFINLQRLRHSNDRINFYFQSLDGAPLEVESLKIIAHTLERK